MSCQEFHKDAPATRNVKEVLKDWVPRDLAHEMWYAVKGKRKRGVEGEVIADNGEGMQIDDRKLVDDDAIISSTSSVGGPATGEAKEDVPRSVSAPSAMDESRRPAHSHKPAAAQSRFDEDDEDPFGQTPAHV